MHTFISGAAPVGLHLPNAAECLSNETVFAAVPSLTAAAPRQGRARSEMRGPASDQCLELVAGELPLPSSQQGSGSGENTFSETKNVQFILVT